jgi:uncharacterized protein YndB with AHSA1/START domain
MSTNTIRLHRVLKAKPEKVYRAFLDPEAKCKWIPPFGFTARIHHADARVGGSYRMSLTNFTTGRAHSFGGSISSRCPTSGSATQTNLTIPTCPAPWR